MDNTFTIIKAELRAAEYYRSLRTNSAQWRTLDDLESILLEFEHLIRGKDYETACQVINLIDENYLSMWNYNRRIIAMRNSLIGHLISLENVSSNLGYLGKAHYDLGNFNRALKLSTEAVELLKNKKDKLVPQWLMTIGRCYLNKGQYADALDTYNNALEMSRELGLEREEGRALGLLGLPNYRLGNFEKAINYYREAIKLLRKVNDKLWLTYYIGNIGLVLSDYGQYEDALKYHQESLDIAQKIGNKRWEAIVLGDIGKTYRRLGKYNEALIRHSNAAEISQSLGLKPNEGRSLTELGRDHLLLENYDEAEKQFSEAFKLALETTNPVDQIESIVGQVIAVLLKQNYDHAENLLETQLAGSQLDHHSVTLILGITSMHKGEVGFARQQFNKSMNTANSLITKSPDFFEPYYILALSNAALILLSKASENDNSKLENIKASLARAKEACNEKGVLDEYRLLLNIIKHLDIDNKLDSVII